jgi:hypothetical protein
LDFERVGAAEGREERTGHTELAEAANMVADQALLLFLGHPGVAFSGSLDGHLRSYSTEDGSVWWDFNTVRN